MTRDDIHRIYQGLCFLSCLNPRVSTEPKIIAITLPTGQVLPEPSVKRMETYGWRRVWRCDGSIPERWETDTDGDDYQ